MTTTTPHTLPFPLAPGLDLELVRVRAGRFLMGSESEAAYYDEKPEHIVRITQDYYIGKYPITQAQWKAVMYGGSPSRFVGDDRPVERVSWQDIVTGGQDDPSHESFLSLLNGFNFAWKIDGVPHEFRLPTEAEWEYAAKGGHRSPRDFTAADRAAELYTDYAGSDKLKEVGWYSGHSHSETKPVGLKRPNELGLYDMCGNVWEWCADRKGAYTGGEAIDPTGPETGSLRVLRGGSWNFYPQYCRVAFRVGYHPIYRYGYFGFRVVLAPVPAELR